MKTGIVLLAALALSGCVFFTPAEPALANGANPLTSKTKLTASYLPMNYQAYTCDPGRVRVAYEFGHEGDRLCVKSTAGMMRLAASGPLKFDGSMKVMLRVDGKDSPPLELEEIGQPARFAECTAVGKKPYIDWSLDFKGCIANDGLLTEKSRIVDVVGEGGQTLATFRFGEGANP